MAVVIGRENEFKTLKKLYESNESQFIALYGRRRVGKTHLIREFFGDKGIYLEATGIRKGSLRMQLENFTSAFSDLFYRGLAIKPPTNWREAFALLTQAIEVAPKNKKIIVFLDELPWLCTKRSLLLENLDYFWNSKWSRIKNVILIVCGSAASWMIEKIINAKGGLHNRLTKTMLLEPFTLKQTADYLKSRHITVSQQKVLELYMVMGGIPYYLKAIERGVSAVQAINDLCFNKNGLLFNEFDKLFSSLFDAAELNTLIMRTIAKTRSGVSRTELLGALKLKSGGVFNARINELIAAGFVQRFVPYGRKSKDHYYRVIDEYTLFFLRWIEPFTVNPRSLPSNGHWQKVANSPEWRAWSGYAFEEVCYKHVNQIANALGLQHTAWIAGSWRIITKEEGAQIDLLYDRDDGVISIGEIKHSQSVYEIDKATAKALMQKLELFQKYTGTHKDLKLVMITSNKIKVNLWYKELVARAVTLEDLFL
jgi:predicted AAA+ superfamily ATPase